MTKSQKNKFLDLASALSPENLHCDGEISVAEARKRYRVLMGEWRELEAEVGHKVSEEEVWQMADRGEMDR